MQDNQIQHAIEEPTGESRAAPRQKLLLRTGKLVSEDRELICVVRDVSATGLKVKLFQPIPQITNCELEFANGSKFPICKVWEEGGHAGFTFTEEVDLSEILSLSFDSFPKRSLRINIGFNARISAGRSAVAAQLLNISQHGICIACDEDLPKSEKMYIRCGDLPALNGNLRWSRNGLHGIMLSQPLSLEDLAKFSAETGKN